MQPVHILHRNGEFLFVMIFKQIQRIVPLARQLIKITGVHVEFHYPFPHLALTVSPWVPNVQRLFEATWYVSPQWHSIVAFSGDFAGFFFLSLSLSLMLFEWGDLWARELYRPVKSLNEKDLDLAYLYTYLYVWSAPTKTYTPYTFIHCNLKLPYHRLRILLFTLNLSITPSPHCTKMGPGHVDPETRPRRRRSVILWTEVNIRWTPGKQNVKVMRSLASPWSLMISCICILWSNMGCHDLSGFGFGKFSNKLCVEAFFTLSTVKTLTSKWTSMTWGGRMLWKQRQYLLCSLDQRECFLYFCGQEVLNTAVRCMDPI